MSGHSHWAGIKHKKAKEDKRRGKEFSRLSKAIMSAARRGGKSLDTNLMLQYAVEEARAANMPKETIERAILKGAGELEGEHVEAVRYEGYGSGGVAVMVDAITNNRNRTSSEIRKVFESHGGKLGGANCVAWTFQTKGLIILKPGDKSEDEIFDVAVEAGAEDFQKAGDFYELTCPAANFKKVVDALKANGIEYESAQITEVPTSYVDVDVETGRKNLALVESLQENDDVENVYANFNLPEELVKELGD
jgi:YebC/PmpR family DNA-binding regulatory protein